MTKLVSNLHQSNIEDILSAYNRNVQTEDQEIQLVSYIKDELYNSNKFEPSVDDIAIRMTELLNGYSLRQLVKKGLLEVYIDDGGLDSYGLSALGKDVAGKIFDKITY
jgi:hypothetical protein